MAPSAVFDTSALFDALDVQRRDLGLGWYELADRLWEQSSVLNARRDGDHPLCGGAVSRLQLRGATSCQYALHACEVDELANGPVCRHGPGHAHHAMARPAGG